MKNNKICHLADLHVHFGSRHEEHEIVFRRTVEDIQKIKPRRIVIAGDLFHQKINMSPASIRLIGNFLRGLSAIAPVDVILGNHDLSLNSLSQGNCIEPIIELLDNGKILKKEEKPPIQIKNQHPVLFYPHSGFYNVDEDIIYGVYSCLDNEILKLNYSDRIDGKTYIALFHGPMYGCRADNGSEMKGDDLIKPTAFDQWDMVLMGDIHEYQIIQEYEAKPNIIKPAMAYPGSILQMGYGESQNKGYLLWDIEKKESARRNTINDYGYAKINISHGEIYEDRINDIKWSFNKAKTKVWIEFEDYEENYSIEKLNQIRKYVKQHHSCEVVNVDFKPILKNAEFKDTDHIAADEMSSVNDFETLLTEYLKQNSYDDIQKVLELAKEIDQKLNYVPNKFGGMAWKLDKMEIKNILSFGNAVYTIDFDKLNGIIGIFGENFSGKSNIIKALLWTLYQKILGDGESTKIVNIYSGHNIGYGKVYFTIGSQQYYCYREATIRTKKDLSQEVVYKTEYKIKNEDKNEWEDIDSSEYGAVEKKERKRLISETIGTFDDFTSVSLQSQSVGNKDYLEMSQQEKNQMVGRFLGLEIYRDRYELANEEFKKIKTVQRTLGDPTQIETEIEELNKKIINDKQQLDIFSEKKKSTHEVIDELNLRIRDLTSKKHKIEGSAELNEKSVNEKITLKKNKLEELNEKERNLSNWLQEHCLKEIPLEFVNLRSEQQIKNELEQLRLKFFTQRDKYTVVEQWIKLNPKKEEIDYKPIEDLLLLNRQELLQIKDQLRLTKGEKCPTCKHVTHEADPIKEKACTLKIGEINLIITKLESDIASAKQIIFDNNNYDKQANVLDSVKNSLLSDKLKIDQLKAQIENAKNIDVIKMHNEIVQTNSNSLLSIQKDKQLLDKEIDRLNSELEKLIRNKSLIIENENINQQITNIDEEIKEYKVLNLQYDSKIKEYSSEIRVNENGAVQQIQKLKDIKDADNTYKKYSIYLQSVDKQGIPGKIISKKLSLINYRINSMLRNIVDFQIELTQKNNSDIKEVFYFSSTKEDALPISMASGSQRFLGSLAVKIALQSVSMLQKPSVMIIDEGWDVLDANKVADVKNVLQFMKTKYDNIIVLTHKSEIKDMVEHSILVSKTKTGVSASLNADNNNVGISEIVIN